MKTTPIKKYNKQEKLIPLKPLLIIYTIENENIKIIKDSLINNLLKDFKEIEELLRKNLYNIIKSFYFSKKKYMIFYMKKKK